MVVDFWAPWCGPCKAIAPILEELAGELGDSVKICKVNVDNNSEIAGKYEVRAIPTILVFKGVKSLIPSLAWWKRGPKGENRLGSEYLPVSELKCVCEGVLNAVKGSVGEENHHRMRCFLGAEFHLQFF